MLYTFSSGIDPPPTIKPLLLDFLILFLRFFELLILLQYSKILLFFFLQGECGVPGSLSLMFSQSLTSSSKSMIGTSGLFSLEF